MLMYDVLILIEREGEPVGVYRVLISVVGE